MSEDELLDIVNRTLTDWAQEEVDNNPDSDLTLNARFAEHLDSLQNSISIMGPYVEKPAVVQYQPMFNDDEDVLFTASGQEFPSWFVYSNFDNAIDDFPDRRILVFKEGDIENPTIFDV